MSNLVRSIVLSLLIMGAVLVALSGCKSDDRGGAPASINWAAWAPSGSRIAVTTLDRSMETRLLWAVDAGGVRQPKLLTRAGGDWCGDPVWRGDGEMLAIAGGVPSTSELQIVHTGEAGGAVFWRTRIDGGWPQWSPDGRLVAWDNSAVGRARIGIVDVSARRVRYVPTSTDVTSFPKWSRDGRQISFCNLGKTSDTPPSGFYVVNVDGTGERRVAPLPGMVHAVWRDAAQVVYFLKRTKGSTSDLELWTLNVETGAAAESFRAVGLPKWVSLRELSWSKDRNRALVVASERQGLAGDIYLIDILTRRTRRLTNDGRNAWPSWSGDESEIAFLRDTASLWTISADGTRQREVLDIAALASAAR